MAVHEHGAEVCGCLSPNCFIELFAIQEGQTGQCGGGGGGGGITAHLTIMRIIYTQFTIYNQICSPGPAAGSLTLMLSTECRMTHHTLL